MTNRKASTDDLGADWVTPKEAARRLGVDARTLNLFLKREHVPCLTFGKSRRIRFSDVEERMTRFGE